MRVVSHPEADEELEAAALWYDHRQTGLGNDFLKQFERTLLRIDRRRRPADVKSQDTID